MTICSHVWANGRGCSAHAMADGLCFAHSPRQKAARKRAARNRLAARVGGLAADTLIAESHAAGVANKDAFGRRGCRRCGARAGQRCRTRRGRNPYPWSYVHVERRYPEGGVSRPQ